MALAWGKEQGLHTKPTTPGHSSSTCRCRIRAYWTIRHLFTPRTDLDSLAQAPQNETIQRCRKTYWRSESDQNIRPNLAGRWTQRLGLWTCGAPQWAGALASAGTGSPCGIWQVVSLFHNMPYSTYKHYIHRNDSIDYLSRKHVCLDYHSRGNSSMPTLILVASKNVRCWDLTKSSGCKLLRRRVADYKPGEAISPTDDRRPSSRISCHVVGIAWKR